MMHKKNVIKNNKAWILLLVSLTLFTVVGIGSFLNRGLNIAEHNMLPLALAFNDVDNGLNVFLTSRQMEGFEALKKSKSKFNSALRNINENSNEGALSFLPTKFSGFLSGSDLTHFDFSKVNEQWGNSQKRIDFLIQNADAFKQLQTAINNTQEKNKVMQEEYKALIGFLVDNYFSGTKVAVIQRQPWLADRISLRLLWLQRPLAFSPKSVEILKAEANLFAESSITLLNQQLGGVAKESDELNQILISLTRAIIDYNAEIRNVISAGDKLTAINMYQVVGANMLMNVDDSIVSMARQVSFQTVRFLCSPLVLGLLFLLAWVLGILGILSLRDTLRKLQLGQQNVITVPIQAEKIKAEYTNTEEISVAQTHVEKIENEIASTQVQQDESDLATAHAAPVVENALQQMTTQQELEIGKLVNNIDKIQRGDLSVHLDEQHVVWGEVAERVNTLVGTMKQLVKALNVSADQTALIAGKRNVFNGFDAPAVNVYELQQQSYIMLERMKILDLNLKVKLAADRIDEKAVLALSNDVQKLKFACENIHHELSLILSADPSMGEESAIQAKLFDNLQELSVKLKAIAARFKFA